MIISRVDHPIPNQWPHSQDGDWLVLSAAGWLNLWPEIIANVPRETCTGVFNHPQAGHLRIGAINLVTEGLGVIPPTIVHLIAGFVTHLPHN
jgi:hypothetical protein